jgi:cell division protein FtsL
MRGETCKAKGEKVILLIVEIIIMLVFQAVSKRHEKLAYNVEINLFE